MASFYSMQLKLDKVFMYKQNSFASDLDVDRRSQFLDSFAIIFILEIEPISQQSCNAPVPSCKVFVAIQTRRLLIFNCRSGTNFLMYETASVLIAHQHISNRQHRTTATIIFDDQQRPFEIRSGSCNRLLHCQKSNHWKAACTMKLIADV